MTLKIGSIVNPVFPDCSHIFDRIAVLGMKTCQICVWNTGLYADKDLRANVLETIRRQMEEKRVAPSAYWAGYSGPVYWNFSEGPLSLGLVPAPYRSMRIRELCQAADFAKELGLPAVVTHCGFIPENMTDPGFRPVVLAIVEVARHCKSLGLQFWFETGQETPVTLLRTIKTCEEHFGLDNLGINLDPANLLLYGKGCPVDALEVFGKYVRNIHVKDGCVPTDGVNLGAEKQVGQGMVHYPVFIRRLRELGFQGEFIIEREIAEDENQLKDIRETMENLEVWWNQGAWSPAPHGAGTPPS